MPPKKLGAGAGAPGLAPFETWDTPNMQLGAWITPRFPHKRGWTTQASSSFKELEVDENTNNPRHDHNRNFLQE